MSEDAESLSTVQSDGHPEDMLGWYILFMVVLVCHFNYLEYPSN